MDAPYNNAHSLTFARMKHNTCVMRARSLHRRILIQEETAAWEGQYKIGECCLSSAITTCQDRCLLLYITHQVPFMYSVALLHTF